MKHSSDLGHFCQRLAPEDLTEVEKAVALLWYADQGSQGVELTARELADRLHSSGLTGVVNTARLEGRLARSRDTLNNRARGTFRVALSRKHALDERFAPLLRRPKVEVSDSLLPADVLAGTRDYLERIGHQINGCYDAGFYDACAVLCRRLIESLLIAAFEQAGHSSAIQQDGSFLGLEQIIAKAKSGAFVKLARNTGRTLDKIKEIGDTAAHDRYHIATEQDIAEFRSSFRRVVSELLVLAGIR